MKPGDLLCNRYQIEKALAAGGFGETYLAIDLHLPSKPQVVVKHLKPLKNDPVTLQIAQRLFEAEAKVLEELGKNSKRIPTLYTYFEDKIEKQINQMVERHSEFYLVQEFIEGQTLTAELKSAGGKLSETKVIEILQEILAGVQEVHQQGKIHRDLKPDNIIRRLQDGKLVLIDFGAVKEIRQISSAANNAMPSATVPIGTIGYMPMEQTMGFPRPASDVYAVGAIGIQCLTGKHPNELFNEAALALLWQHHCQASPGLAAILEKMVAQNANHRYFDGTKAAEALEQFLNSPQPQLTPISTQPSTINPPPPVIPAPNAPMPSPIAPVPPQVVASVTPSPTPPAIPVANVPVQPLIVQTAKPQLAAPPVQPSVAQSLPQAVAAPLAQKILNPRVANPQPAPKNSAANNSSGAAANNRSRRNFLRWLGFGGVGVVGVIALSQLGKNPSTSETGSLPVASSSSKSVSAPQLTKIQFTSVKLDSYGKVIDRPTGQSEIFTEDLGNEVSLKMVKIPAGKFMMGSPTNEIDRLSSESPQHLVTVPGFYMGQMLITQAQWQAIMGNNPANFQDTDERPVNSISWLDAMDFCQKLSQKTGRTYRLPSEAEWEYACRAGTTTPFAFGENITPEFVYCNNIYPYSYYIKGEILLKTTPANSFGLYNMHGYLWEWCLDEWQSNYNNAPVDGSARGNINSRSGDKKRLLRGGSWNSTKAGICRSACRRYKDASGNDHFSGLRVVAVTSSTPNGQNF
jgi:eukaryotic-like serine/threonine-protein kinase